MFNFSSQIQCVGKTAPVDSEHGKCSDIIVPRTDLIEKVEKIKNLETRLNQHESEHTFELEHERKLQSLELQKTCENYENVISQLKKERQARELRYCEEKNIIKSAMEDRNTEHSTSIIQLEAKLNEKILAESNKSTDLKVQMDQMIDDYEKKLQHAAECLDKTVEIMKRTFEEELHMRDSKTRELLDEIKIKKGEFFQYCNQLNLDNDRKMTQMKLKYETELNESNDNLLKWRTEASILTKKIESTSTTCDQLRADIAILLDEHGTNKKYICQLEQNIAELQREIDVRTKLVNDKEVCLLDAIEKKQKMEQMKKLFNERAIQLEALINPLNEEIKRNCCTIKNIEDAKKKLQWKVEDLNIEIQLLGTRCKAITNDLKMEKAKSLHLETIIQRMSSDICALVQHTQDFPKLKELSLILYKTYVYSFFKFCFFIQKIILCLFQIY